ncbi:hypothetical protein WQ53_13660 [Pseudoxanthomonas suwonensis]|uniref:Secreted protein n=1 Tax=Pseudoxanthomonas suwonensis TaxID=314722 RepID=A0A0E3Z3Z3_9GAMM|nr:hypothetical protein WQ53_13660 [Pseudoxanthomonas suwonensis]
MRHLLPMLLVLPLAHCSCQRHADDPTVEIPVEATLAAGTTAGADGIAPPAAARASSRAAEQAASTLHAYLGALPGADHGRADAYWAGGGPGNPPDDAVLRGITGLRGMRIQNDPPQALDRESPPRAFEIPVHLRLDTAAGPVRMQGWYRLRARVDGQGWEITSASLQPVLG